MNRRPRRVRPVHLAAALALALAPLVACSSDGPLTTTRPTGLANQPLGRSDLAETCR